MKTTFTLFIFLITFSALGQSQPRQLKEEDFDDKLIGYGTTFREYDNIKKGFYRIKWNKALKIITIEENDKFFIFQIIEEFSSTENEKSTSFSFNAKDGSSNYYYISMTKSKVVDNGIAVIFEGVKSEWSPSKKPIRSYMDF